jgi:MinD superfamily P-loop ATPase
MPSCAVWARSAAVALEDVATGQYHVQCERATLTLGEATLTVCEPFGSPLVHMALASVTGACAAAGSAFVGRGAS